jgi:lysophospholipase L1-like esterase
VAIKVKHGQTLLFIGDSITDCGRRAPEPPLGNGYVKLFADLVRMREPAKRVAIVNEGIGGNTVLDLQERWEDDVMRRRPDWLSVKIGINDLCRRWNPTPGIKLVPPDVFRAAYDEILTRTRKRLPRVQLLLIDPFYLSRDTSSVSIRTEVLSLLPAYLRVVHDMSRKHRARLVKTHAVFQNLLKYHAPDVFCPEPVHPYPNGHLVIAEAVYDALSS